MQIHFVNRPDFQVCGFSVETSLKEGYRDVENLYNDYFCSDKAKIINDMTNSETKEYYGLMWYLKGHERYRYLLGKEAIDFTLTSTEVELIDIPAALYAVVEFEKGFDNTKAWTDFFFESIPQSGYTPDYEHGYFFEFYPNGMDGNYELWTPVVKIDAETL